MTLNGCDLKSFWKGGKENCQESNMASVTVGGFSLCAPACSLLFSGWVRLTCSQICGSAGASLLQDWFIHPLLSLQFAVNLPVATFGSLREVFLFSVLHICCRFQRDLASAVFFKLLFICRFCNLSSSLLSQPHQQSCMQPQVSHLVCPFPSTRLLTATATNNSNQSHTEQMKPLTRVCVSPFTSWALSPTPLKTNSPRPDKQ